MGVSSAVLEALRESHEESEEEDCCCCCWEAAEDDEAPASGFGLESEDSPLKRSRNFWISGSAVRSLAVGGCLLGMGVSGLLLLSAVLTCLGEEDDAQSQPILRRVYVNI